MTPVAGVVMVSLLVPAAVCITLDGIGVSPTFLILLTPLTGATPDDIAGFFLAGIWKKQHIYLKLF